MFDALRRIKNGTILSTRELDDSDFETIGHLFENDLITGIKSGKGYVNLKLTQKGEQYLKFGETPLSDFTNKHPWYQKPLGMLTIGVAIGLIVAFLTYIFGWQGK